MDLPVSPPVSPMLAKAAKTLPVGDDLIYEPKWDGFRCIVFRDGDELELGSRNERPLTRYFPEVVAELLARLPDRCVIDGELVIAGDDGLQFEALLQRIHPAESRVRRLSVETPASFVAFDLLALGDEDLTRRPFSERRQRLEEALGECGAPVYVTPATRDPAVAADWFERFEGAGLDGVVAKSADLTYQQDKRVMTKVKHQRTADCVVAGFRWHKKGGGRVGSLLLGLFDSTGRLQHVGVTSSFTDARRLELVAELEPYRTTDYAAHPWSWAAPADAGTGGSPAGGGTPGSGAPGSGEAEAEGPGGRVPGAQSRWNAGKDLSFEFLRPALVCEVAYDHLQGDRFRHATTFQRWRPDRKPESCRYDQLETVAPAELAEVFGSGG